MLSAGKKVRDENMDRWMVINPCGCRTRKAVTQFFGCQLMQKILRYLAIRFLRGLRITLPHGPWHTRTRPLWVQQSAEAFVKS